ncbi:MAG: heparan-alpha-glucosaminide N-acetyltransferase domain-containing protein [Luteolibacter sp.]
MTSKPKTSPPVAKERVDFIDALRGYAILMMIQGHTVDVVLRNNFRTHEHLAYALWDRMRGLTAPTFFFAAGLIFAYLLLREEKRDPGSNTRLLKGLQRAGWLIVLGFLAQFHYYDLQRLLHWAPDRWEFLSYTHVLHTIAITLVFILLVFRLVRNLPPVAIPVAWLFATMGTFFLSGKMLSWQPESLALSWISLFTHADKSYFAIFPWAAFGLAGACFGWLIWKTRWHQNLWFFSVMALCGSILLVIQYPFAGDHGWLQFRLSAAPALVGIIGLLSLRGWIPEFVLRSGRETLTLFLLHLVILYGAISGFGLHKLWPSELNPIQTILLALIMEAAFITLAWHLPMLRKRLPLLRWIS